jgi:Ca2+-binding EF-hand superfamily protein
MATATTTTTILSASKLDEIRSAFCLLDVHNTGRLAVADLVRILRGMMISFVEPALLPEQQQQQQKAAATSSSSNAAAAVVQQLLDRLEQWQHHHHHGATNSNSSSMKSSEWFLSLDEFTALLTTPHPNDPRDAVAQVFDLFDTERKGYISLHNLRAIAVELGEEDCSESLLLQMMGEKDLVSLEDFWSILRSEKN